MTFGIIDIVLLAVTAIIMLVGLKKGIVKQLTGGITLIGSIVLAIFVYKYVANYVLTSDLFYNINEKFYSLISSKADEASMAVTIETAQEAGVREVLSAISIPKFLQGMFVKTLADTIASNPDMTVGNYVSNAISTKAIIVGAFILTFIVGLIVIGILVALLRKIADLPGIKVVDRILGMVFSLAKWAVVVCILLWLVTLLYKIPTVGEKIYAFMDAQLLLSDDNAMGVTKWVYLNNPIFKMLSGVSFSELMQNAISGGGSGEEEIVSSLLNIF
ncbi:MAG: CvpA family protein [Bacilli bacterium]|nr:CvpA family protein [Bacilli bacterium]